MSYRALPAWVPERLCWPPSLRLALLMLVLAVTSRVRAESVDDERARAHFVAAQAYFDEQRYDEAAREFDEAYVLSGRPEMLINKSRAEEKGGRDAAALKTLEVLLERHPQTSYRDEAEARLNALRLRTPAEPAPEPAQPESEPLMPAAVADQSVEPAQLWWQKPVVRYSLLGATAGSVVIAIATGWAAHAKYNDLEGRCDGGCEDPWRDDKARGQRLARTSTAFTATALVFGGVTTALFVLDLRSKRGKTQLSLNGSPQHATLRLTF